MENSIFRNRGAKSNFASPGGIGRNVSEELSEKIASEFDDAYMSPSIEVHLLDDWTGVARRPRLQTADRRWAYMIYYNDVVQDAGLLNLIYAPTVSSHASGPDREVVKHLVDIVTYYRSEEA